MVEYLRFVVRLSHVFFVSTCCSSGFDRNDVIDVKQEITKKDVDDDIDDNDTEFSTVSLDN